MELSENPAVPADDTDLGFGGPSMTCDSSDRAFPSLWNTSAGVR